MIPLRSTERHLVLLRIPFGLKSQNKKANGFRRYGSATFGNKYNQADTLKKRFNVTIHRPIRLSSAVLALPTKVESAIKYPLLNPEKPGPDDFKDVHVEPIAPASMPRFSKNSEVLPSVTKILSATMPAASQYLLDKWKESMIKKLGLAGFNKYQQDTFERGRLLHALLATYLMGQGSPGVLTHEVVANLWKSIENVVKENITNVRLVEHAVTHKSMGYRGIVDCVAFYKGELTVIDFKTAEKQKKSIADLYDNPLQITAYCGAINNDQTIPQSVIDRNICSGLVIVAYVDGAEASVYPIGREKLLDEYWNKWTTRLDQYTQIEAMKHDDKGN